MAGRHLQLLRGTSGTGADISFPFRGQIARQRVESNGSKNSAIANTSCRSLSDMPTGDRMNVTGATLRNRASDGHSRELRRANRLAPSSVDVVVCADRGEPVLGVVELAGDHLLDVGVKRGVRAEDEFTQHWHQGTVFAGQRG